jgi:transcriptional regulator with XRE-family HTH domain
MDKVTGEKLQLYRKRILLKTQEQVAAEIGLNQALVNRAEAGNETAQLKVIDAYAKIFKVPHSMFINDPTVTMLERVAELEQINKTQMEYIEMLKVRIANLDKELHDVKNAYIEEHQILLQLQTLSAKQSNQTNYVAEPSVDIKFKQI